MFTYAGGSIGCTGTRTGTLYEGPGLPAVFWSFLLCIFVSLLVALLCVALAHLHGCMGWKPQIVSTRGHSSSPVQTFSLLL